jgi:steroid delta-isomerase-like uncharacterized protein
MNPDVVIHRYYDAFNRQDVEAMLSTLTDDVVHDVNQGGREAGIAAFRAFLERMNRHYRETVLDLAVMIAPDGRRAAAEFVIDGSYLLTAAGLPPATGQRYRLPVGAFFDLRDGRIARVTNYYNLEDWVRQVS